MTKVCTRCGTEKMRSDFYVRRDRPNGVQAHCKACERARYRAESEYRRAWHKDDYQQNRDDLLVVHAAYRAAQGVALRAKKYSLSVEEFLALGDRCRICSRTDSLQVDHDHGCCPGEQSCGQCVRGLLCPSCNTGLSRFKDNPDLLAAAIEYLAAWKARVA